MKKLLVSVALLAMLSLASCGKASETPAEVPADASGSVEAPVSSEVTPETPAPEAAAQ